MWGFYNAALTWEDEDEVAFTKNTAWISALSWTVWSGLSYYLFKENFNMAIMYYDPVLQEKHEEIIQFGEPEKEEDLPEEL